MNDSTLTHDQHFKFNYEVLESEIADAIRILKDLGYKVKQRELTYSKYEVEDGDGAILSPRALIERVKAGFYGKKKTKSTRDAEVEVPPHKGRPSRSVGRRTVRRKGVVGRDTDQRISKRKGTGGNGSRTRKVVRRQHTEPIPEESPRVSRKKVAPVRKRRPSLSDFEFDHRPRKTQVGRKRGPKPNQPKSRGVKRSPRPRRKTLR